MADVAAKLGLKPGVPARLVDVPPSLAPHFAGIVADAEQPEVVVGFVHRIADVPGVLDRLLPLYRRGGRLWIAYPKLSGAHASDISRDRGWEPLAAAGLLAVTQVAIDADWSALRWRWRDEIRSITRRNA